MDNATKPPPIVNKFKIIGELKPLGMNERSAPPSKLVVVSDPRETAQSTVQQVTARTDLTPAEQARSEAPLPTAETSGPAASCRDAPTGQTEGKT